jgi:4-amino-4-deoxy-L-arabinose transferase-like glycosyltransferase
MRRFWLSVPAVAAAFVYLPCAAGRAILDVDEGLYVRAAQEMMARGDWVTPTVNGVHFLDKPPLLYWLLIGLYKLLGTGEFAAHLPPALAVVFTTALISRFAARTGDVRAGLIAGFAFAFCCGTYLFTRETLHDGWMVFFQVLAVDVVVLWSLAPEAATPGSAVILGVALAGGLLSKGLIGVLFPAGMIVFSVLARWWRLRTCRYLWISAVSSLIVAAPWHLAATLRDPGFAHHYFVNEQLLRFLNRREPADFDSIPVPLFLGLVLLWLFPWTPFAAAAVRAVGHMPARDTVVRTCFAWSALVLGFFSLSARLEHYAFSALPPLCMLAGIALSPDGHTDPKWISRGFRALAALGVLLALAAIAAWVWSVTTPGQHWLAADTNVGLQASGTDFGPLSELPATVRQSLIPLAATVIAALAIGLSLAAALDARGRRLWAVAALGATMVIFDVAAHVSLRLCEDVVSSKRFGTAVARRSSDHPAHVVIEGDYETANSMAFYEPWPLLLVDGGAPTLAAGLAKADAPRMILDRSQLAALWRTSNETCVLTPTDRLPSLDLPQATLVARTAGRTLVCNDGGTR